MKNNSSNNSNNNSEQLNTQYIKDLHNPILILAAGPYGCGKKLSKKMVINNFNLDIEPNDITLHSLDKLIEKNVDYRKFIIIVYELYHNQKILNPFIKRENKNLNDWKNFFNFFKNYKKYLNKKGLFTKKEYEEFKKTNFLENHILNMFIRDCKYITKGIGGKRNSDPKGNKNPEEELAPEFDILEKQNNKYSLKLLDFFSNEIQEELANVIKQKVNEKYSKYKKITKKKYSYFPFYKNSFNLNKSIDKRNNVILEILGDTVIESGNPIPSLRWLLNKYGKKLIENKYRIILTVPFISSIESIKQRNLSKFFGKLDLYNKNKKNILPPIFPIIGDTHDCRIKCVYNNFRITIKYFEKIISKKKCDLIEKNIRKCFNSAIFGKEFMDINFSFILFYSKQQESDTIDINKVIKFDSNNIDDIIKLMKKQYSKEIPFYDKNFLCKQRKETPKLCLKKDKTKKKNPTCNNTLKRFF